MDTSIPRDEGDQLEAPYLLEEQIGFILRQVGQRHSELFFRLFGDSLTAMQWAAMIKLYEQGEVSQNLLGRLTAMDAATIKGVVDRLVKRELVERYWSSVDIRRRVVKLTPAGRAHVEQALPMAREVTEQTLAPLNAAERQKLTTLLRKLL